jgi:phage shock protein PspC (stress-responsive transcriptional regulator)
VRKVITVSLNGNAFQLEDDAFGVLSAYLEESTRALASNPDRAEIMADLEQAIGEKCAAFLNAHKSVVTRGEIEQVIAQMGAVDSDLAGGPGPASANANANAGGTTQQNGPGSAAPRRLYQISEGALVSGICNGYAAYSGIDVTWVRVIYVLLILVTSGLALIAYVVLMFIIPYANTSEEHAAAHGLPFNARALVERTKRHYRNSRVTFQFTHNPGRYAGDDSWRRDWRRARAEWRLERRRARQQWRQFRRSGRTYGPPPGPSMPAGSTPYSGPTPYVAHVINGSVVAMLGLVSAVLGVVLFFAFLSIINHHNVFGWPLPSDTPLWMDIVGLFVLYGLVSWPIKAARHSYWYSGSYHAPWIAAWDAMIGLAVAGLLVWYGLHHVPQIREFLEHLPKLWQDRSWSDTAAASVVCAVPDFDSQRTKLAIQMRSLHVHTLGKQSYFAVA